MSKDANQPATKLLTENEAANLLSISHRTLQAWRIKGEGPLFVSVGRLVRYRQADLDAWLESRKSASTSALAASGGAR